MMKKHKPQIGDYVMAECYKAELAKAKHQLAIAVEALKEYGNCENWNNIYDSESADFEPLYWANKWKDEYGYKYAQEKLKQIKELEKDD